MSSLITPGDGDWERAFAGDWEFDSNSIIGKIQNKGFNANTEYFADHFEATVPGEVVAVNTLAGGKKELAVAQTRSYYRDVATNKVEPMVESSMLGDLESFDSLTVVQTYRFDADQEITVNVGEQIEVQDTIALGEFTNDIFYIDLAKILLGLLFIFLCALVYAATSKREKMERKEI